MFGVRASVVVVVVVVETTSGGRVTTDRFRRVRFGRFVRVGAIGPRVLASVEVD